LLWWWWCMVCHSSGVSEEKSPRMKTQNNGIFTPRAMMMIIHT